MITLLRPDALGSPAKGNHLGTLYGLPYAEYCGFAGVTTIVLALVGLGLSRTRHFAFFVLLAVAGLNIAMGGPLARLMYLHIPGLGQAGGFSRFLSVYTFAVAMAGGLGLDAICRRLLRRDDICLTDIAGDETGDTGGGAHEALPPQSGDCPWNMSASTGLALVALALVIFELLPWAHGFLPRTRRDEVYPATPLIAKLLEGKGRVLAVTPHDEWGFTRVPHAVLPPNSATVYGYDSAGGYDSLFPRSYREFVFAVQEGEPAPAANGNMLLPGDSPQWALANVEQVVDAAGIYDRRGALPRAFTVRDVKHWTSGAREFVSWAREHPRRAADVTAAAWARPAAECVTVNAPDAEDGDLLVVTETLYPGWRARVDGGWRGIRPVAGAFIGVPLRRGDREVRLVFLPDSVQAGLFCTLLGMGLIAGIMVASRERYRRGARN
ncbi:MAG: hypothetical protein J7M38_00200 [Armatimonadetes bacterium]|nr:hypothetical protein [Armatimonadota bacterium]